MKKIIIRVICCCFLSVLTIFALIYTDHYQQKSKQHPAMAKMPATVESIKAAALTWQRQIHVTGNIEAFQGITIKSPLNQGGIINRIHFNSGDEVKKGQPLFSIHPANTTITAPFEGKVGLKQVDLGEYISSGMPLVSLQQIDPLRVEFNIPQVYLDDIDLGQTILVTTNAYPQEKFQGRVYAIDNHLDPDTRSIKIWAQLPNQQRKLYPGMFVDVLLYSDRQDQVIALPQSTLVYSQSATYVYKIENNQAVRQDVKIGLRKGEEVQIIDGITAGDEVILAGQAKVSTGMPVVIKNDKDYPTVLQANLNHP